MARATLNPAAIAALALMAAPAAAQITADDLWASQTAIVAAFGATPTGTLSRDGAVVTLTDAGARYDLPLGLGSVSWRLGAVTLTENADGSVGTTVGDALSITLDADIAFPPGVRLSAEIGLRPEGLERLSTGAPGDITTTTSAERVTVELVDLRIPAFPELDGATVLGLVLLEGVASTSQVTGGGPWEIRNTGRFDRMVTDFLFALDGMESRDVGEYRDSAGETTILLPVTRPDLLNLGPALRDGLSIVSDWQSGETRSQTVTRFGGEIASDDRQTIGAMTQSLRLDRAGLAMDIDARDIGYATRQDMLGLPEIDAAVAGLRASVDLPLLAGMGRQSALLGFEIDGLEIGDGLWTLLSVPPGALDVPAFLTLATRLEFEPAVDLTDVMRLGEMMEARQSPATLFEIGLDALSLRYGEADLSGSGAFGWGEAGEAVTDHMAPPQGQADFLVTGAYALLDRLSRDGILPRDALLGARAALAALGRPTGADRLESTITFGPDGPRVNGAPIPF